MSLWEWVWAVEANIQEGASVSAPPSPGASSVDAILCKAEGTGAQMNPGEIGGRGRLEGASGERAYQPLRAIRPFWDPFPLLTRLGLQQLGLEALEWGGKDSGQGD